jgi:hypothetical protein
VAGGGGNNGDGDGDEECTTSTTITDCEVFCSITATPTPTTDCYTTSCNSWVERCGAEGTTVTTATIVGCSTGSNDPQWSVYQQGSGTSRDVTIGQIGPTASSPTPTSTSRAIQVWFSTFVDEDENTSYQWTAVDSPNSNPIVICTVAHTGVSEAGSHNDNYPPNEFGPLNIQGYTGCNYLSGGGEGDEAPGTWHCDNFEEFGCVQFTDSNDQYYTESCESTDGDGSESSVGVLLCNYS